MCCFISSGDEVLSKVDYKLFHPNLLRNDVYINHYQQIHCDFDVIKPKKKINKDDEQIIGDDANY